MFPCENINDDSVNDVDPLLSDPDYSYWIGGLGPNSNDTITIDLGGVYTLTQIDLYNTHNGRYNNVGTNAFNMWISSVPQVPNLISSSFGTLILNSSLSFPTVNPNPVQSFTVFAGNTTGRYLTFRALTSYDPNGPLGSFAPGLSELDVFGDTAASPVPEPATIGLVLLGLAGVARRARRRGRA